MPIIMKPGEFKPSDAFGLYRDRQNPFEPAPAPAPDPAELQRDAEIRAAEEANDATEANWAAMDQAEPGRYQLIDEGEQTSWEAEWQARQPGWIEDTARLMGGSLAKGSGAIVGGLGNAITSLTNATTTPVINSLFGTNYGQANPLAAPADWINTLGEKTQEGMSFATREAIANSTPDGDLLDPSSWTLGEDPSAVGYAALALDVFGQMVPVIAASVIAGPAGGAIVGGLQGGGASAQQAETLIDQMAAEPGVLERESAYYREQLAAGRSHEEALAATKAAAAQTAFILTAPISGLGGFATAKIIDPATAVLAGRNLATRIAGRAGLSAMEEGLQEAAESVAGTAGTNIGAGTSFDLTEGTFADFLLGALAGSAPGAVAGALTKREAAPSTVDPSPAALPLPAEPMASPQQPAPSGPLSRSVEHGTGAAAISRPPTSPLNNGERYIVNDPALPGMGAGQGHGQSAVLSADQSGAGAGMVRVTLDDGSERLLGTRLLLREDGSPVAPDPQATTSRIAVGPSASGLPTAGSRVIVNADGLPSFNGTVEQYITNEDGSEEAIVSDQDGEVLQVPIEALSSLNLSRSQVEAMEVAENPPPPPMAVPDQMAGRVRPFINERGAPVSVSFPDDTLAQLYDLGAEREQIKRLNRATGEASGLAMRDFAPDRVRQIADALGVLPERINDIADDYRFRAQRAARKATGSAVSQMHSLEPGKLQAWQNERKSGAAPDLVDTASSSADNSAAVTEPDPDTSWWDGLGAGARRALLATARVKRSEKTAWASFSKPIRAKLSPLRAEMEGLDRARQNSQALDDADSTLDELETAEEVRKAVFDRASESMYPDHADHVADRAVERWQQRREAGQQLDVAANEAATSPGNDRAEPTAAQKEAGNYKLGHARLGGLDLSIENPAGSERKGTDKSGKAWSVTMKSHYGYIRGTVGKDKDHVDVFVRPGTQELGDDAPIFVIDQVDDVGALDEHKVMMGFPDEASARAAYLSNYTKGWKGLGAISRVSLSEFKKWLKSGNTARPFGTLPSRPAEHSEGQQARSTPYDAAKELPGAVLALLRASGAQTVSQFQRVLAEGGSNKELLETWDSTVGKSLTGLGPERVMLQARGKALEVSMPSADGAQTVRKVLKGGDLARLIREALDLLPVVKPTKAGIDGVAEVGDTSAPGRAQLAADPRFEPDRRAMARFKKGDKVEFTRPGTFTQSDGSKVEGLVITGSVESVHSKEMGTFTVAIDRGGTSMVAAGALRPRPVEAVARDAEKKGGAPEHPGLLVRNLRTGKERTVQPKGTVRPAEKLIGVNRNGYQVYEDENGVRSFVEKGIRITETVGITPGSTQVTVDVAKRRPDFKTAAENNVREDFTRLIADLKSGLESWAAEGGNELLEGKLALAERLQSLSNEDFAKVDQRLSRDHHPGMTLEPQKGLAIIDELVGSKNNSAQARFAKNKLFTADKVEAARARLRSKINQINSGPDPEVLMDGMTITGAYIEAGIRDFAHYAGQMVGDFGEGIRPYLLSFWEAVRHYPGLDTQGMTPTAEAARIADALASENADDAGTVEPSVDRPAGDGVGSDAGRAEPRPQPGPSRAYTGQLAQSKPSDVEAAAEGRSRRVARPGTPAADVEREGRTDLFGDAGDGRARASGAGTPDAGAGERSGRGGRGRTDLVAPKDPKSVSPANTGPGDFHIDDPLRIVGGGQVARFEKNRRAIEVATMLREEGRRATREEQEVLAGYTGWGSFGQDLFQGTWANARPKQGWEARDTWLRDSLGQKAWESLQRSITNAHYTDPPTVMAMWDMVKRMGFDGGRVLEPSMGIGNFFGMMPLDLKTRSNLTGIELEQVTGEMARQLYPNANISIMGYQDSKTPDNFYDLVIGNWPFENTSIADRRYNRLSPFLHDYFYLKAVDQVRPGGLVVGITSKGTLDKKDSAIRSELAKKAELVAAFRLPTGAFAEYAGTAVVTDIIILRKRPEALGNSAGAGWIRSVDFKTPQGEMVALNEYFVEHPDHVIGKIEFGRNTTSPRPGMIVTRPDDMSAQLQRIVELVPEGSYQQDRAAAQRISYITNHTADREGALVKTDKGLFVVRGEHLAPAADIAKYEVKDAKATATRVAQLEALIDLRKAYAELISAERAPSGSPDNARQTLKQQYDAFVAAHGSVTESFGLGYLSKIDDPFYPALAALETREAGKVRPATILERSTIRATRQISEPTVSDAFVLARNASIHPTLDQIAEIARKAPEAVKAELIEKGAVFELPAGDIVPSDIYLSGNVREKMRQAQASLAAGNGAMQRNVDALAKVMPADIPYYNIEVQMGASWVPNAVYADYIAHMLNTPSSEGVSVSYTAGRWRVVLDAALKGRPEATAGFGTKEYSFQKLVNAAIGNQTVTIRREDPIEKTTYVDTEATAEVNDKIATIRSSFGDWLWSDPERRLELETEYNEVRNAYASPSFDGSFLTFEGMALTLGNGPFDLRSHQANAIWRGLAMRRSLNAHEVGTGKTFTMGGIAVESRRYGLAKKPLILAHNANSASVAAEIGQMYPAAKVLYIDNLAPNQIDVKLRQIANDDWDAVVVPHSLISRFALTEDTLMGLAAEEIAALEAEAYAAAEDDGVKITDAMLEDDEQLKKLRSPTAKELVKMRNRIIENIKKQGQRASREGALSFEELGIDMVLVDEVHEFKKPPFSTRMRMKGLNTQSSDRSIALSFLLRYIRSTQNGGNVHLFTGTPVTNTLTEVFHAMRYIMAEEMGEVGVDQWDGWFGSFAREVQDVELNAAAEYEAVNRLAGFINVPELRRMIGQYMDVVFADDMPEMQPRRTKSGKVLTDGSLTERERLELLNGRTEGAKDRPYKKVIVETADLTPAQQRAFRDIQAAAQRWRKMSGKERREVMQAGGPESPIITEGMAAKASFDARLLDGEQLAGREGKAADDPNSKASRLIRNVSEIYRSHKLATQVIFTNAGLSNVATRSVGEVGAKRQERYKVFSTVGDIVARLVADGVPRSQIAVVDGSTSKEKRKEIADAMNRAEIRVTIGSTQSLGVGVNMQRNLRAMHHLDAPWMPGDLEQRNGRGLRQANQWNTVLEYRYLTDRIDGRRWQVLAIKQRFINAFLKADDSTRVIEGDAAIDEESDILTTFAEAAGDPRVLIREKLRKKIDQFKNRERLHDNGVVDARRSAERLGKRVAAMQADLARLTPIGEKVAVLSRETVGQGFTIQVAGKTYDKRSDARDAIEELAEARQFAPGMETQTLGSFGGFPLKMEWKRHDEQPVLGLDVDGELIAGNLGSLGSLESRLRGFAEDIAKLGPEIAQAERSIERLRSQAREPFHQAKDLARTEADLAALEKDLTVNPVPPPAWLRSGAPIDTEVMWKGEKRLVSGHRWNGRGWFVLTPGEASPIEMPYAEVNDDKGMPLYDERAFVPPEVVDRTKPTDSKKSRAARPDGRPVAVIDGTELGLDFRGPEDMPALRKAAAAWYDQHLVGTTAKMADGTEVRFNTRGRKESTQGRKGDILLRSVPAIRAIIEKGEVVLREPGNRPNVIERLVLRAPVSVMGETINLVVSVHRSADGQFHYDFNRDRGAGGPGVSVPGGLARQSLAEVGLESAPSDFNIGRWVEQSKAGRTADATRAALRRGGLGGLVEALEKSGKLRIVSSDGAPDYVDGVQGWTDPDGTITLIADQIEGDPVAVLLHEAFHSGGAELLGGAAWRQLMVRLAGLYRQFEGSKGAARQFFDKARNRVAQAEAGGDQLTEPLRVEEFAAYAIEEYASAPAALARWVDDLVGTVKAWVLRRFGRQVGDVTPSQLQAIAKYALLESVGAPTSPLSGMASRRRSVAAPTGLSKAKLDRQSVVDALSGKLTDLKPAMLAAIPLNYFTELKRPGMVAVDQYLKVKRMMDAYRGNKHAKVDEVAQAWRKYARLGLAGADKTGRARAAALADLMHETTLAGIDPTLTDEETKAKAGYKALRAKFLALPRSGQELYETVRDTYREQADELDSILLDNVRKTQEIAFRRAEDKYRERLAEIERSNLKGLDRSQAEKDAQDVYQGEMRRATYNMKARMTKLRMVFEASRVPAPYFPLARFGQYFVTVRNLEGDVLSFSRRETDAERRRLERDLRAAYPYASVESGLMADNSAARDMMDPRIVTEIETLLGDAGVDERVMDMIWQRYLETMPDLSARKRFIHRKGVAGFDGDALRTFASNQFHAAHQMARLKYGLELAELSNQSVDQAKKADDPVRGMQLANELRKRHEWVMNPTGSQAVQRITSTMFVWYLAATPAAALVNLAQTPMVGIPVLGARLGGLHKATAAIGRASADVLRGRGSARSASLTADERRAMEAFYESGMIDRTQAHDLAGVGEVGVAYSPVRHKVMSIISWAFHNAEIWNREVTALAAYRMARAEGHHETKAIDLAHELTWKSHFDYSNASRARLMQGDFAKVALTFQSHQLNMWYRIFRDIHQAIKGETHQARKEARYQLAGVMGMTALFTGVTGVFGYNVLMALLGLAFDDDDDPRAFKEEFQGYVIDLLGKDLGGIALKGLPGHLTGIDLTSRLGMPDFFVRAPDGGSEGKDWFRDLIIGAMGVVPSTMLNAVDGAGLISQGNVARGLEVMAPKAIKDLMQAYRYASEGVLSRRGDVTLERYQLNALDVLIEAVGFTPAKIAETYERMGTLKDAEQRVIDERRALMNQFALAVMLADPEARRAAIEAIKSWNRKPYARTMLITGDSLTQSLRTRARNSAKREDGVLISDKELGQYLRDLMPRHLY